MDVQQYAAITEVCLGLAGRLADETVQVVCGYYSVGEWYLAETSLLLNLAYEGVGITQHERDLIIPTLCDEASLDDLGNVEIIEEIPLNHRFTTRGPRDAPKPREADAVIATAAARSGFQLLKRVWRTPNDGSDGTWTYLVQVPRDGDPLVVYSTFSSVLTRELGVRWPVDAVVEGSVLPPYQAAALAAP